MVKGAIKKAPGVLVVKVNYETRQATIYTKKGEPVPRKEILAAIASLDKYSGKFVDE